MMSKVYSVIRPRYKRLAARCAGTEIFRVPDAIPGRQTKRSRVVSETAAGNTRFRHNAQGRKAVRLRYVWRVGDAQRDARRRAFRQGFRTDTRGGERCQKGCKMVAPRKSGFRVEWAVFCPRRRIKRRDMRPGTCAGCGHAPAGLILREPIPISRTGLSDVVRHLVEAARIRRRASRSRTL